MTAKQKAESLLRKDTRKELIAVLEPAAIAHGMELVEVELLTISGQPVVRVYLESADESGTVSIDALAEANKWVDPLVEAIDPYPGAYMLELSSPGINRPLRTRRHFERFLGEKVRLRTQPIDGRANWTGVLTGMGESGILLIIENETIMIALDRIIKANVVASLFENRKGK